MAKTLRVRTRSGWVTKPAADTEANRLSAEEVDDNFLALEDEAGKGLGEVPASIVGATASNVTLDFTTSQIFEVEPTADILISATGLSTTGRVVAFLNLRNAGDQNVTFGTEFKWVDGAVPELSNTPSIGYSVANASYDGVAVTVSDGPSTSVLGLDFNDDGTKLYVVGNGGTPSVAQYTLPTPYRLSGASYDSVFFDVSTQAASPTDCKFSADGMRLFILDNTTDSVYQYNFTTAYDFSTASYSNISFPVGEGDTALEALGFSQDGRRMYIGGGDNDKLYQYTLPTGFDLSTARYDDITANTINAPAGMRITPDGEHIIVVGSTVTSGTVRQYKLPTPFELTGMYQVASYTVSQTTSPKGCAISADGTKLLLCNPINGGGYQYSISSTLTTAHVDVIKLVQYTDTQLLAMVAAKGVVVDL